MVIAVRKRICRKVINVFTPVCQSFWSRDGGGLPQCMLGYIPSPGQEPRAGTPGRHPPGQTPPWADTPLGRHPPWADTPSPTGGHCRGRYASYWNAFLLAMGVLRVGRADFLATILHVSHVNGSSIACGSYNLFSGDISRIHSSASVNCVHKSFLF